MERILKTLGAENQKLLTGTIIYTADDEEPECGKCDHNCDGFNCSKYCGPEHGWNGYCRTEFNR